MSYIQRISYTQLNYVRYRTFNRMLLTLPFTIIRSRSKHQKLHSIQLISYSICMFKHLLGITYRFISQTHTLEMENCNTNSSRDQTSERNKMRQKRIANRDVQDYISA